MDKTERRCIKIGAVAHLAEAQHMTPAGPRVDRLKIFNGEGYVLC